MANRTRADLVTQALANLSVLAAGQNPAAEDYEAVDAHVDDVVASLNAREIIYVQDANDIPPEWFQPLAVLLADDAALEFGMPGVPASPSAPSPVQIAEDKLRQMARAKATGEPQETEYF